MLAEWLRKISDVMQDHFFPCEALNHACIYVQVSMYVRKYESIQKSSTIYILIHYLEGINAS